MPTSQLHNKAKQTNKETPDRKVKTPAKAGVQPAVMSPELQAALADPQSARPETILQLQRMVGNRAVSQMLTAGRQAIGPRPVIDC